LEQFDFSSKERNVSEDQKTTLLKRLVFSDCVLPTKFKKGDLSDFKNHHVIDFNADGKLDIMYDGRNSKRIETNNAIFFLPKKTH
jgi:hypothetical protein